jgi:oligopeptide/dipeptide ABC transporter ATP-binding protein
VSETGEDAVLLSVEGLRVRLQVEGRVSMPVDDISFHVKRERTLGLVGESGCGKSMTALSILRLLPHPIAEIVSGQIRFEGQDLAALAGESLRAIRGRDIAMIFQEPMTSLNPVYSCGEQIAETLRLHEGLSRVAARDRSVELLDEVQISDPARRAKEYPHQLSGGMRQRVMIAMAIACRPKLLIADEPTTALDVTIQRQILELLDRLQKDLGMGVLHITHDLAVIAETADDILVMYAGRIVEAASVEQLFAAPAHPYSLGLLACRPALGGGRDRLPVIAGSVPDPYAPIHGCRFAARCPFAVDRCLEADPPLQEWTPGHHVACFEVEAVRAAGGWPSHV